MTSDRFEKQSWQGVYSIKFYEPVGSVGGDLDKIRNLRGAL